MPTPPLTQLVAVTLRSVGPHRVNATLPVHVVTPPTVTTAWSRTVTEPVPIETSGTLLLLLSLMAPPAPVWGVVVMPDEQSPKLPRTKSLRTAVVDCDERVSEATEAKHSPPRLSELRFTPPSYISPWR